MKTFRHETISRLPASRFPDPAQVYFCDSCGRDLTKNLYRDRAPVWQPLRPMWSVCQCGQKYLSGAAEWDDLSSWERKQRIRQLWIGLVLFALLVIPGALAYFALRYGGAALLAIVGIALIPSVLVAKPFGFVLLDLCEIITSIWRTRVIGRTAFSATIPRRRMKDFYPHKLRLTPIAAAIAMIIIATRWIPPHHAPASSMGAMSSPPRANAGRQESLSLPAKLPRPPVAKVAVPGAPSPAFRRVQVGPNEVDYIAEDVTIRHFLPTVKQPRIQPAYKEVHIGPDVTIRYFASKPADATQTRLVSLDRSLPLSK